MKNIIHIIFINIHIYFKKQLVDNEFEEHVLEYSRDEDGLYLHGINDNKVEFISWPSNKVHEVAKEFNLRPVEYLIYDNITGNYRIL